ncbi:MAG: glycosyltransferase family 39 protein [Planctomycetota bacterium]
MTAIAVAVLVFVHILCFAALTDAVPKDGELAWLRAAQGRPAAPGTPTLWPVYPSAVSAFLPLGLSPRTTALLVNALASAMLVVLTFLLARARGGATAGLLAAILISSIDPLLRAQREVAPWMLVLALLIGFAACLPPASRDRRPFAWSALSGVLFGVGLLTDPRFGLVAGALISMAFLDGLTIRRLAALLAIASAIATPWYVSHWKGGLLLLDAGDTIGIWNSAHGVAPGWTSIVGVGWWLLMVPALWPGLHKPRARSASLAWLASGVALLMLAAPSERGQAVLWILPPLAVLAAIGLAGVPSPVFRRVAYGAVLGIAVIHQAWIPWASGLVPEPGASKLALLEPLPRSRREDLWHARAVVHVIEADARDRVSPLALVLVADPMLSPERLRWLAGSSRSRIVGPPAYRPIGWVDHHHLGVDAWIDADVLVIGSGPRVRDRHYYRSGLSSALRTYARPYLDAFDLVFSRSTPNSNLELWRRARPSTDFEKTRLLEAASVLDPDDDEAFRALASVYRQTGDEPLALAATEASRALSAIEKGRVKEALRIWNALIAQHPRSIFSRIALEDLDRMRRL